MAMMSCTYAAIGRELWGQRAIGEATAAQKEGIRSKRRVRLMQFVISNTVVHFSFCKPNKKIKIIPSLEKLNTLHKVINYL